MSLSTQEINELTDDLVQGIYGVFTVVPMNVNDPRPFDTWKENHDRLRDAVFNLIVALDRK